MKKPMKELCDGRRPCRSCEEEDMEKAMQEL